MCYFAPTHHPLNPVAPLTVGQVSPYGAAGSGLEPYIEPYVPITEQEWAAWRREIALSDRRWDDDRKAILRNWMVSRS